MRHNPQAKNMYDSTRISILIAVPPAQNGLLNRKWSMSHIFISYSKQDIDFVRYLRVLLESEGFTVWMDEVRLAPSARWWKSIESNIETCAAFVVVMSPDASESDWVEREILLAERLKKPLFPVLVIGEPWSRLANIQYEDMRTGLRAKLSSSFTAGLRRRVPVTAAKTRSIVFTIEEGDVTTFPADVAAFKYASNFQGADATVGSALIRVGVDEKSFRPEAGKIGDYRYVATQNGIEAQHVLYVTTPHVRRVGYTEIRQFAARVLEALTECAPETRHLIMTLHGPNFGLDETESFFSQFAGYRRAMLAGHIPPMLEQITLVEQDGSRVKRLRNTLDANLTSANYAKRLKSGWGYQLEIQPTNAPKKAMEAEPSAIESAGAKQVKPHAFVTMPMQKDVDDVFFYGIQAPIHAMGLLCERIDQPELTNDLLEQARQRIESASVVVADLTGADPLVYLHLGYAWGKNRPVILLAHDGETIHFETDKQALCLYHRIKDVEDGLSQILQHFKSEGLI